jgi:rhodanese-related sulfurtransferase
MSSKASTTIGFERRFNHALTDSYQDFMANAGGAQPPRPPNMEAIVELNRGPFFGAREWPRHEEIPADAIVLDVRDVDAYAAGHLPGAVNVPVNGSSFGTKAAFVLPERPIHLHALDEAEAQLAARRLWAVAIFDLAGWSEGGGPELMESTSIDDLERLLAADAIQLLDVRETDERDRAFIPGSKHLPYRTVRQAAENGLCGEKPIVTICESGPRAAVAASVLRSVGLDARPVLDGGVATWNGERCTFRRCGS